MFVVKKINFSYSDKKVIKNMKFTIEQEKFTAIIGPDGSGKTTLLNLLMYNLMPDVGEIIFLGQSLFKYSTKELSKITVFISQNIKFKLPLTCFDIVSMGRRPFKGRFDKLDNEDLDIIYKSMKDTDTLDFADSLITELSDGEKQRVIFAKALAQTPKIFFLDEAFSSMDMFFRLKCLNILKEMIKKENISVIAVLNDLNLVDIYSDSIIAINKGKLIKFGKREDLMNPLFLNSLFKIDIKKVGKRGIIVKP